MFKTVENVSKKINNGRTPDKVFYQLVEEVGELSKEVRTKYDPTSYKKEGVDGILGESCDILISLLDFLMLQGFKEEQIIETIVKKCNKWENKTKDIKNDKKDSNK